MQSYNLSLHTFPSVIWASTLYHAERPIALFQASDAAQNAPTVNFDAAPAAGSPTPSTSGANTAQ